MPRDINTLWAATVWGSPRVGGLEVAHERELARRTTIDSPNLARQEAIGAKIVAPTVGLDLGLVQKVLEFDDANR